MHVQYEVGSCVVACLSCSCAQYSTQCTVPYGVRYVVCVSRDCKILFILSFGLYIMKSVHDKDNRYTVPCSTTVAVGVGKLTLMYFFSRFICARGAAALASRVSKREASRL